MPLYAIICNAFIIITNLLVLLYAMMNHDKPAAHQLSQRAAKSHTASMAWSTRGLDPRQDLWNLHQCNHQNCCTNMHQHAPTNMVGDPSIAWWTMKIWWISSRGSWWIMIHWYPLSITSPELAGEINRLEPAVTAGCRALGSPDVPLMDSTRSPARTGWAPFERLLFHKGTAPSAWWAEADLPRCLMWHPNFL